MKEGWEYKTLGQIAKVFAGGDVPKNRMSKCKKEPFIIPIYTNGIENEGLYGYTDIARVNDLSLTISARGTIGAIFKRNNPFFPAIRLITVCPQNIVDINFLYYVLLNSTFTKSGTTIPQLTVPMLKQYRFAIPENISIQQNIANYLDSSFKLIDEIKNKALKSLTEAKALFQSALAEAMEPKEGTVMERIGDVFTTYAGGTPLKSQKDYYEGGEIPWLRSGEVCKKYISETELYITQKGMDNSSAKFYPENTVVVAMYGATAAQVGILKIKATSNQAVCGIIPHKDFIPEYVYYWFLFVQDDLASQAQGGAQPNISQIKIKNVLIPIINKEEQKRIVSHLDKLSSKVRAIEEKYQKMVEECDALKQAMLRDVFE